MIIKPEWFHFTRYRGYFWDANAGRYVSRWTGKPVAELTIRRAGRGYVSNAIIPNLRDLTTRYYAGSIDLATFQKRVMYQYKSAWLVQGMLGKGGRANMTQADWGKIGYWIKRENGFFYNLMLELQAGMLSEAQLWQRLQYYAHASEVAYWDMYNFSMAQAGMTEERRIIDPLADNCDDCINYEEMGWQPLDSLPPPKTECKCMRNCRCIKEYR